MAQAHRLRRFDDLSIIGEYAERFGLDPDKVFTHTSFDTIINFLEMWKESSEYQERFQFFWHELQSSPVPDLKPEQ